MALALHKIFADANLPPIKLITGNGNTKKLFLNSGMFDFELFLNI